MNKYDDGARAAHFRNGSEMMDLDGEHNARSEQFAKQDDCEAEFRIEVVLRVRGVGSDAPSWEEQAATCERLPSLAEFPFSSNPRENWH